MLICLLMLAVLAVICALTMKAFHMFFFVFFNSGMLDKNRHRLCFSGRCVTFSLLFISRVSVINALENKQGRVGKRRGRFIRGHQADIKNNFLINNNTKYTPLPGR